MNVLELEGTMFQINLLNNFLPVEQEAFLKSTINELAHMSSLIDQIIKVWRMGDFQELQNLLNKEDDKNPRSKDVMEKLLYNRNDKMVETINKILSNGKKVYIIVGAAHLVGDRGIINQLKTRGIKIKQL